MGRLSDETVLKRVPRGFDPEHPAAHWLKHQSFTMGRALTDDQVLGSRLTTTLESDFALLVPLVRWLNSTLGLQQARQR